MATITTINSGDLISDSRSDINDNFTALNSDKIETSYLDTDTTLAANSDTKIATQKAVKAYVDSGGNVNASTTQKGIVEEATQAEVDAGTATGATGARLYINPSTTFSTKKAFTGSATSGAGEAIAGATLPVPVYQNKTDNQWYKCDGNDLTMLKFQGFAITTAAGDAADITIQFSGIVSGFTGLSEGEKYYLSDTVGTIAATPGTYEVLVGIAISETELLIQKGKRRAIGTTTFSDAGNENQASTSVITTGFRPSLVRFSLTYNGATSAAGQVNLTQGIWNNGTYAAISINTDGNTTPGSTGAVGSSIKYYRHNDPSNDDWTITVTSVTDTGFTITATQNDDSPNPLAVMWEAEGEL